MKVWTYIIWCLHMIIFARHHISSKLNYFTQFDSPFYWLQWALILCIFIGMFCYYVWKVAIKCNKMNIKKFAQPLKMCWIQNKLKTMQENVKTYHIKRAMTMHHLSRNQTNAIELLSSNTWGLPKIFSTLCIAIQFY